MYGSIAFHLSVSYRALSARRGSLLLTALLLGLFWGAASRPASAQANLLANGSFEEPRVRASLDSMTLFSPGLSGWHITEGSVALVRYATWQPAERQGQQSLVLGSVAGAGGIEQSFPTQVGQYYLVSGWLAHDITFGEGQAQISLNGEPLATVRHNDPAVKANDMRWKLFAYRFQAKSETTTLKLAGAGAAFDGLAVTLAGGLTAPAPFFTVDLSRQMNFRLFDGMLGYGNDLADLGDSITPESPIRVLQGVPFLLDGLLLVGPGYAGDVKVPRQIQGIPVGRKAARLYLLQGCHYIGSQGANVGSYVVHYADGTSATIPIRYGLDLADWWGYTQSRASEAVIAWRGRNEAAAHWDWFQGWAAALGHPLGVQLYLKTWVNPTLDVEITSLDLVNGATASSGVAPFLVAVTGS